MEEVVTSIADPRGPLRKRFSRVASQMGLGANEIFKYFSARLALCGCDEGGKHQNLVNSDD